MFCYISKPKYKHKQKTTIHVLLHPQKKQKNLYCSNSWICPTKNYTTDSRHILLSVHTTVSNYEKKDGA